MEADQNIVDANLSIMRVYDRKTAELHEMLHRDWLPLLEIANEEPSHKNRVNLRTNVFLGVSNHCNSLVYCLPRPMREPNGPRDARTLIPELETLTFGKYNGDELLNAMSLHELSLASSIDEREIRTIIELLERTADIVIIANYVWRNCHAKYPERISSDMRTNFVNDFQSSGGIEMVEALYEGVAVEDLVPDAAFHPTEADN